MTFVLASLGVLAAGAAAPLVLGRAPRLSHMVSMVAIIAACAFSGLAAVGVLVGADTGDTLDASWPIPLGSIRLAMDGLSAWFLMTIALLGACVALYTPSYAKPMAARGPIALFGSLMCVLVASLILLVCAADAVLFLVAWESMTLAAFFLVSFHHEDPEVRRGAWMYLIATHIGTAVCVVPMFAAAYAMAGTTAFSAFPGALESAPKPTLVVLFVLGVIGFGTKAGLMPMHVWLPAAHPVAPTPVSALLSGVVVKMGIFGILRLLTWLPPLPPACGYGLLLAGVISGVMGVLYALAQHDIKRLLAYHSVENIGIIVIGVAVGMIGQARNEPALIVLGYAGALLHVANHAMFKGLLFLSAGAVLHDTGTVAIERLGGLAKRMPVNAAMFLVGAIAICGLPPLNGFLSEWVIYGGLWTGTIHGAGVGLALGILSLALMGGLALACFAKVFGVVFLGEPRDPLVHVHSTPVAMNAAMAVLAIMCALIGVLPGLWLPLVYPAASVLAGMPPLEIGAQLGGVLASGIRLTVLAGVMGSLVVLLSCLRWFARVRSQRNAGSNALVATWGCAYAQPTARMQYTATSFASPLVHSFRGLLWPEREWIAPAGPFPSAGHMEVHAPDIAEKEIFRPLFSGVSRLFAMMRSVSWSGAAVVRAPRRAMAHRGPLKVLISGMLGALRRGSIQTYILFIVLTLVFLLLFEWIVTPHDARPAVNEPRNSVEIGIDR